MPSAEPERAETLSDPASSLLPCKVRVAIVQLACHPAFAVSESDWLAEPFFAGIIPIQRLLAHGFEAARGMREEFRALYLKWAERRLRGVLDWLKRRFPKGDHGEYPQMPDILVFPEGAVPRQHLRLIKEFAEETETIVFAGTHAFEIGQESTRDYITGGTPYISLGLMSTKGPYKLSEKDQRDELERILRMPLSSLSVLPIFVTKKDGKAKCDSEERLRLLLRPKLRLSPFELTEIGVGIGSSQPQVLTLSLPTRAYRAAGEPDQIQVLPMVCAGRCGFDALPEQPGRSLARENCGESSDGQSRRFLLRARNQRQTGIL